jgi:hypothetical protein
MHHLPLLLPLLALVLFTFLPETSWDDISEPEAYVELGTADFYWIPEESSSDR